MSNVRDYVMARLAAAHRQAEHLKSEIGDIVDAFVDNEEDDYTKDELCELMADAINSVHLIDACVQAAKDATTRISKKALKTTEWEELGINMIDDDEDEDEDDHEDDDGEKEYVDETSDA